MIHTTRQTRRRNIKKNAAHKTAARTLPQRLTVPGSRRPTRDSWCRRPPDLRKRRATRGSVERRAERTPSIHCGALSRRAAARGARVRARARERKLVFGSTPGSLSAASAGRNFWNSALCLCFTRYDSRRSTYRSKTVHCEGARARAAAVASSCAFGRCPRRRTLCTRRAHGAMRSVRRCGARVCVCLCAAHHERVLVVHDERVRERVGLVVLDPLRVRREDFVLELLHLVGAVEGQLDDQAPRRL